MKLHQINRIIEVAVISISAGLLLLFSLGQIAHASPDIVFTVDTVLDQNDNNIGDGQCHTAAGHCSLRAALEEANAGSGAVIDLPSGTFTLTLTSDGALLLQKNITLNGDSTRGSIIQGDPTTWNDTILFIDNNAKVTLNRVAIRYGHISSWGGGGLWVHRGTLALNNSVVASNTAQHGGGGIYNEGRLTITL